MGEGPELTKGGRDKQQRHGEARQIPIIYSAGTRQFALGVLWASFLEGDGQLSV